ncbi:MULTISPECIES: FtsX-like permease family protein [unclassified Dehalobacter]|uniref:ABC transporter permease n=1 Tax=unclassified Dehalobacter TaxID=2635733 RepID=UPI000E6D39BB|nr:MULTISPECIES: FtsX-like permease family protein [unclassified Dehalobacter]RJE49293.1 cell division protein FtsX [Dehalobacter sp. MCB1]TCX53342.1 cell division protein FtsX [Dehalobacter sp. 14DCB1]TCX54356.1 cell division protein FtsX [Dehalobacter sp. 12DCB1]
MRKRTFYPKLAFLNIQKNGKFYLPYLLTCIITVAMFYIMRYIATNSSLNDMLGAGSLKEILFFGSIVVGIFAAIFLFYTNSFLMKRRKKELGLYNILGMEKRHIAWVLLFETFIVAAVSLVLGLSLGILLSKLIILILFKMLKFTILWGFSVSSASLLVSVSLFFGIFLATLLSNLMQIRLAKPIELLHGSQTGEREPKTKWILAILGILTLGTGYTIAIVTESPLSAISLFFIAVILVIIGTYCLFTAGSIVLLKFLRKNKHFFYQTKHFIAVSGMIYRMKQNAVGLSNICILSTMVLVMVSTTVSLYNGMENLLDNRFPTDISVGFKNPADGEIESRLRQLQDTVSEQGRTLSKLTDYTALSFAVGKAGDTFTTDTNNYVNSSDASELCFITTAEYEHLTGKKVALAVDEVLVYSNGRQIGESFSLFNQSFRVREHLDSIPITGQFNARLVDGYFMVVSDDSVLDQLYAQQKIAYGNRASSIRGDISFNLDGTDEEKLVCYDAIKAVLNKPLPSPFPDHISTMKCRQAAAGDSYALYGGFLFLGLFLGTLFLMATVLIIYYKQISEGYDDKERFEIMQKVGLSRSEVKRAISSQIVMVFFLPILMAGIHILAAFKMITKLLAVLNLTNIPLFISCTVGTILVFGLIYGVVYTLTARVYYRIVS